MGSDEIALLVLSAELLMLWQRLPEIVMDELFDPKLLDALQVYTLFAAASFITRIDLAVFSPSVAFISPPDTGCESANQAICGSGDPRKRHVRVVSFSTVMHETDTSTSSVSG